MKTFLFSLALVSSLATAHAAGRTYTTSYRCEMNGDVEIGHLSINEGDLLGKAECMRFGFILSQRVSIRLEAQNLRGDLAIVTRFRSELDRNDGGLGKVNDPREGDSVTQKIPYSAFKERDLTCSYSNVRL